MKKLVCARRSGALTLEAALVIPLMAFLLLGMIIGGMGVLRFQQVACQAREAARFASVHGGDYQIFTGAVSPTELGIFEQTVEPMAAGMALKDLTLQVQWVDQSTGKAYAWDSASKDVLSITPQGEYVTNTVRITVSYQWTPDFLGLGPLFLQSTSEIPMAY
jgi:Flp pilus assembly protein TadG